MAFSKKKLFKRIALFSVGITSVLILFYISVLIGLWGPVPTKKQLSEINQSEASQVLASGGELLGKYFLFDRQSIAYNQFPKHLIDALIATEDARFYEHNGIDGQSLFRVFFKTILLQDASSGGGSTITQQLAKNLYGRNDVNKIGIVVTKLRESIIARRIEELYSKEKIIELYFNTVPFSDNTFGIESASKKFFNKPTAELSLSEAATLVGTLKASTYYNPRQNPKRSRERRNVVLSQMVNYKYLKPEIAQKAQKDSLILDYQYFNHNQGLATYFRETVRKKVLAILDTLRDEQGKPYNLYNDGLLIHTTIDYKMQHYAEEAMHLHMQKLQQAYENSWSDQAPWITNKRLLQSQLKKLPIYKKLLKSGFTVEEILDSLNAKTTKEFYTHDSIIKIQASVIDSIQHYMKLLNTGMIAVEPSSGAVKTWIGGIDYTAFQYDHVSQSKRQVGSVFKPIVFTAALENGIEACSYYSKNSVIYKDGYTPSNSSSSEDEDPYLNYSLKYALSNSVNTIAVQLHMDTGIEKVITQAEEMGITSPLPKVPSLALGTAELSVLEVAKAYTPYTNDGFVSTPIYISKIETKDGKTIANFESNISKEKAFSDDTRYLMVDMMKATVNSGTAKRLRSTYGLQNDIAGKTGTTQDNKDAWFVALTPKLTTVVWVGNDLNIPFRSTSLGQGANAALPMFAQFYKSLNNDENFRNITNARFDNLPEHLLSQSSCEDTKRDGFLKRLFTNPDKNKKYKEKNEKGGLFSIFRRKDKN